MSRYITPSMEADICKYLSEWESGVYGKKLTWDILSKSFGYSRQALSGNNLIKSAYDSAKNRLKEVNSDTRDVDFLIKENKRLERELEAAQALIHQYEQKYIRWQINAIEKSISVEELNKELITSIKEECRKRS